MLPKGLGWGDVLLRAVFQQDLRVRVVSPLGHGEVWTPSVRPQPNRPRARLRFTAPAPGRLPGLLNAEALAERQSYAYPSMGEEYRETRYRLGGGFSDWVTSWLRWEAGVAFDRIASVSRVAVEGPPERAGARRPAGAHRDRRLLAGGRRRKFVRHPGVRRDRAIDGCRRRAGRHHAGRHRRRIRHVAAGGVAGGESDAKSRRHAARASPPYGRHHHRRGLRAADGLLDDRIPASAAHPLGHRRPGALR